MNDKGVCITALATPGLSKSPAYKRDFLNVTKFTQTCFQTNKKKPSFLYIFPKPIPPLTYISHQLHHVPENYTKVGIQMLEP